MGDVALIDRISSRSPAGLLARLHPSAITDEISIRALLSDAAARHIVLQGRRTLKGDAEQAIIQDVAAQHIRVRAQNLSQKHGNELVLSFSHGGRGYSFSSTALDDLDKGNPRLSVPTVIYVIERRERARRQPEKGRDPTSVRIRSVSGGWTAVADIEDLSAVGMNLWIQDAADVKPGESVEIGYAGGEPAGMKRWGQVRHVGPEGRRPGWQRIGVSVSQVRQASPLPAERRPRLAEGRVQQLRTRLGLLSASAVAATARVSRGRSDRYRSLELVDFQNAQGELIRGIVDRSSAEAPTVGVIVPPAWGRTKETLLPLALTIVETFRSSGESVAVLRFDGTRRRGESFKPPGCNSPGLEHLTFTFSSAVEDILAAVRFVGAPDGLACGRCVLVTFSAAAIEGRRAVVRAGPSISGWVSVVGTPDLQSGLKAVSGGVDYVGGAERDIRFGLQEIMGVLADIDLIMSDAIRNHLPFLEDARRDMEAIQTPVTWIHGAHDGWLDLGRVSEIMGCGDRSLRRLIEVPTGHQLRSSVEALEVFQLVAREVARLALHREVRSKLPDLSHLERARLAERERLPKFEARLLDFWRDYLIGREGRLGIEMMNATTAYRGLMDAQIDGLRLGDGHRVADLGSGTGSFLTELFRRGSVPKGLMIDEVDFVDEALERAGSVASISKGGAEIRFVRCDLEDGSARRKVLLQDRYDSVLMSLVLGYLSDPEGVLRDIRQSIVPGGRLVVSAMRRDADVSRLFNEAVDELKSGRAREAFGAAGELLVEDSVRSFLNDAARLLDLEEAGIFRFMEADELRSLVVAAGFRPIDERLAFGDPPQATVLIAVAEG